jgi:hypothetical protein
MYREKSNTHPQAECRSGSQCSIQAACLMDIKSRSPEELTLMYNHTLVHLNTVQGLQDLGYIPLMTLSRTRVYLRHRKVRSSKRYLVQQVVFNHNHRHYKGE